MYSKQESSKENRVPNTLKTSARTAQSISSATTSPKAPPIPPPPIPSPLMPSCKAAATTESKSSTQQPWQQYIMDFKRKFVKPIPSNSVKKKFKNDSISILRTARSLEINLLLSKITLDKVMQLIETSDITTIDETLVERLAVLIPTPEELILLQKQSDHRLAEAETALLKIINVDYYHQRIQLIISRSTFEDKIRFIESQISRFHEMCLSLKSNKDLFRLFGLTSVLLKEYHKNNFNKFMDLFSIKFIKTKDGKQNMLNYVVEVFINEYKKHQEDKLLSPMRNIDSQINIDFAVFKKHIDTMESNLNDLKVLFKSVVDNNLKVQFDIFFSESIKKLQQQYQNIDKTEVVFVQTKTFFDFSNPCTPKDFCSKWTEFKFDFNKAWDEVMNKP